MSPIVDRDTWLAARLAHLEEEKAFTRRRDELSRKRRELPWTEITEQYEFEGVQGHTSLGELFGGKSQLIIYHFMFGAGWAEGCPSCSFWADNFDGIGVHLAARDTALAAVAIAPVEDLTAYRARMGWSFPFYSSAGSQFNYDMGVSLTAKDVAEGATKYNFGTQPAFGEESAGISVLNRTDDGRIFLSYQTFARGLDMLNGAYHYLDLTPKGRDEDGLDFSMAWLHRHDAYPHMPGRDS